MGPPSYMWSDVDRNVMWRIPVKPMPACSHAETNIGLFPFCYDLA